jgi:hypothetical protein
MSMIAPAFINTTLLSLTRLNDFSRQIEICEADSVQCLWQKDAFFDEAFMSLLKIKLAAN